MRIAGHKIMIPGHVSAMPGDSAVPTVLIVRAVLDSLPGMADDLADLRWHWGEAALDRVHKLGALDFADGDASRPVISADGQQIVVLNKGKGSK
jgi:hypothetical protein